jgi:CRISPR/Cas system-associated exonuclease Cas4 (RecB family)
MNRIGKPFRISPSSIGLFFKCAQSFKWAYIDEEQAEEYSGNYYAVLGTSFHKAMELDDLFTIDKQDIKKFFKLLFYTNLTEADINWRDDLDESKKFISRGLELLEGGYKLKERWKSTNDVVFNEKYFRINFPNKFFEDVYISGKIDLAIKGKNNDIYTILDWKTSKTLDNDIDNNSQITIYIYYLHKTYSIPYENIFGALAYPAKDKILFTQRTEEDVKSLFANVDKLLENAYNGNFEKATNKNACFFCAYKKKCLTNETQKRI